MKKRSDDVPELRAALVKTGRLAADASDEAMDEAVIKLLNDFADKIRESDSAGYLPRRPEGISARRWTMVICARFADQWSYDVLHSGFDPLTLSNEPETPKPPGTMH